MGEKTKSPMTCNSLTMQKKKKKIDYQYHNHTSRGDLISEKKKEKSLNII